MSTAAVIKFDNLVEEAKYAFRAGDYAKVKALLGKASDIATLGQVELGEA